MCRSPHPSGCQPFSRRCSEPSELTLQMEEGRGLDPHPLSRTNGLANRVRHLAKLPSKLVPILGAAPSMPEGVRFTGG